LRRGQGADTIDIERLRPVKKAVLVAGKQRALLIVMFIPSVDRDANPIDQDTWTRRSLEFLGLRFGGATAFPRAQGVWRDDERGGKLVWDEPVIVHCYASERQFRPPSAQMALGEFCRVMGRSTNQGEVGLVIDNVYHAIRL
jgi:hypothetical protein